MNLRMTNTTAMCRMLCNLHLGAAVDISGGLFVDEIETSPLTARIVTDSC